MKKGRIIKLIGGIYTVKGDDNTHHSLKPRGVFRHKNESPKVGDMVEFEGTLITKVYPRVNELIRPPIVNVDQAILINATKSPNFSTFLLDRFLILAHQASIEPVIVINKIDLLGEVALDKLKKTLRYYEQFYDVYFLSAKSPETLQSFETLFKDKVSVLAGQTGSGKSSLLNTLDNTLDLKTGETSKALGRGRHTTRHTELLEIKGGLIADTPGFSKLDFYNLTTDDLPHLYPDFFEKESACKFRGCHHINEPKCAIKKAVENNEIPTNRYNNYQKIYEEIKQQKPIY